ncbi:similar to transmembrane protein 66 precursor [Plenodomus lingam JN3]|uniref:Store-operated calcium entry-associated regulatory factor n=1 Tax=Leptosphaeria maculans (strain JN3 / isolate v23.1.3 / race Av1-4-5-6-7-8) TaxID=985895 RepID=E5ABD3_LEPMJ|nr:similar to transmembrane protein 66 precursor [Plenodomus lingam JN3]CBY00974.1 similar to transmembrane protein 66 precursor [Plenodomus lingam JN3]
MRLTNALYAALLATSGVEALRSESKVKLKNIQSLTLRKGLQTSHRRVDPIPQLKCIGGSGRGLYEIDVMRCKNSGSDYDENNIQWTCTASLPEEFKLGSTDVICEGYDYPEDPYILKGSCGVEYRLILTDKGRERYGKGRDGWFGDGDGDDGGYGGPKTMGERIAGGLFWCLFIGVVAWMIYSAYTSRAQGGARGVGGGRPGWGGGGGGGGGWGGGWGGGYNDDHDDPPPPYYPSNPGKQHPSYGTNQGWRPGFWSGAAGGAAAAWAASRMANTGRNQTGSGWGNGSGSRWGNGEGSSRSSSGDSFSNSRHESTGFGSTSRR